jgi:hypothetical protein
VWQHTRTFTRRPSRPEHVAHERTIDTTAVLIHAAIVTKSLWSLADRTELASHAVVFVAPLVGKRKESHTWDESTGRAFLSAPGQFTAGIHVALPRGGQCTSHASAPAHAAVCLRSARFAGGKAA